MAERCKYIFMPKTVRYINILTSLFQHVRILQEIVKLKKCMSEMSFCPGETERGSHLDWRIFNTESGWSGGKRFWSRRHHSRHHPEIATNNGNYA